MNHIATRKIFLSLVLLVALLTGQRVQAQISAPEPCDGVMTISFGVIPPTCSKNFGTATAIPNCGYPPFSYAWSNGTLWNTILNVPPGNYTVTVTDSEGQQAVATVTIPPSPPNVEVEIIADPDPCTLPVTLNTSVSGGSGNFNYEWSTGEASPSITVNAAGTYTVIVVDTQDPTCRDTASIQVGSTINVDISTTPILCFGDSTGSAVAVPSGGTAPYTFQWCDGTTNDSISGLPAGNCSVTVTDANGCTAVANAVITGPDSLTVELIPADLELCDGTLDTLTAVPNGGTAPYTYAWNPSNLTGQVQVGLSQGTYDVTVTDANGCTAEDSYEFTPPPGIDSAVVATIPTGNPEDSTGTATANVFGGTGPYTYVWDTGDTPQTISNLPAGTYCVTVTDANGCTAEDCGEVEQDTMMTPPLTVDIVPDGGAGCGDTIVKLVADPMGGVAPYTYNWNTGDTTMMIFATVGDTAIVTVTDSLGSMASDTLIVPFLPAIDSVVVTTTPTGNPEDSTGTATANVFGGMGPYTYVWDTGDTTQTITNLPAGTYCVTVTDVNGCTAEDCGEVEQDTMMTPPLTVDIVPDGGAGCGDTIVKLVAEPMGGIAPYTYNWNTGDTTMMIFAAVGDTAIVTVTDSLGSTASDTLIVPFLPAIDSVVVATTPTGNPEDSTGTATANVFGGTGPYTYVWDTGDTTQTITNLPAGTYCVTVTDINGCTAEDCGEVEQDTMMTPPLTVDIVPDGGAGCGDTIVKLVAEPMGGIAPYTYNWNTGDTTMMIFAAVGDTAIVTVTDSLGSTASDTLIVPFLPAIDSVVVTTTPTGNPEDSTGTATANVFGGTGPYTYVWDTGDTTQTITNLPAGTYCVTVTDVNGCTAEDCGEVEQDTMMTPPLTVDIVPDGGAGCGDTIVKLVAEPMGGVAPYTYNWNTGDTTMMIFATVGDTAIVTVTDSLGSMASDTLIVPFLPAIDSVVVTTTPTGNPEDSTGTATANVFGGTGPYTYVWDTGDTTQTISNLPAGTYCVTVTDVNGCTAEDCGEVEQDTMMTPPLTVDIVPDGGAGCGDTIVKLVADPMGGVAPYTYNWNTGDTTMMIFATVGDTAIVTVTDSLGSMASDTLIVPFLPAIDSVVVTTTPTGNPEDSTGTATANVFGGTGPYTYVWDTGDTTQTISNLPAGTYCVTVTDANGCTAEDCGEVEQDTMMTPPLTVDIVPDGGAGCGDTIVKLVADPIGGVAPYTYNWNTGDTTMMIFATVGDTAIVTVTDSLGSMASDTLIVPFLPAIDSVVVTTTPTGNPEDSTGTATANVFGGTGPYTYVWDTGDTTQTISNLPAGTYCVTVTDVNGCTAEDCGEVEQDTMMTPPLTVDIVPDGGAGCGDTIVKLVADPMGGIAPYTYNWNTGDTTMMIFATVGDTAIVTVTDSLGAMASDTLIVPFLPAIDSVVVTTTPTGNPEDSTGTATANVFGGTGPYTYVWDTGDTTQTITNLPAGTYCVTVTDVNGCTAEDCGEVEQDTMMTPPLTVDIVPDGGAGCGDTLVKLIADPMGGIAPYTYNWNTGDTTMMIFSTAGDTAIVTVTDSLGSMASDTLIVPFLPAIDSVVVTTTPTGNPEDSTGTATANVFGGTGPYTYVWDTGDTTQTITNLPAGTYCVTVTDVNGCTAEDCGEVEQDTMMTPPLTVDIVPDGGAGCGDTLVKLVADPMGGIAPYTYNWNTGDTTMMIFATVGDTAIVTVTDSLGAMASDTLIVPFLPAIDSVVVTTTPTGNPEDSTGTATANVFGGTGPYTYVWDTGDTTQTITNLPAGTYCVTVTDANGCTAEDCGEVEQDTMMTPPLTVDIVPDGGAGCGDTIVKLVAEPMGGIAPYTYNWNTGDTTMMIFSTAGDTAIVTVTDSLGSMASDTLIVPFLPAIDSVVVTTTPTGNPEDSTGTATANVFGGTGPYTYVWDTGDTTQTITNLPAGTYCVTVTDVNGCTAEDCGEVEQDTMMTPPLTVDIVPDGGAGCGDTIVKLVADPMGGVAPYTYNWNTGDTTMMIFATVGDTAIVTVTDSLGAMASDTLIVPFLPAIDSVVVTTTPTGNPEDSTGTATANVFGGTGPYTYLWDTGDTTQTISNLPAGTYCVTVTDVNGCTAEDCGEVEQDTMMTPPLTVDIVPDGGAGCGDTIVKLVADPMGGVAPYTYNWNTGDTTMMIFAAVGDTAIVTVTDSLGAMASDTLIVPFLPAIDSVVVTTTPTGNPEDSTGTATANVFGGTGPYTYLWDTGDTTQTISNLPAGTYCVTVTDVNGCTDEDCGEVEQDTMMTPPLTVDIVPDGGAGCGDTIVKLVADPMGGVAPYTYNWNTGDTTMMIFATVGDTAIVTVTDSLGATASDTLIVPFLPAIDSVVVTTTPTGNPEDSTGTATANVFGGTGPYTYVWDTGDTTQTITNLPAGTYCVTVTDVNGCTAEDCGEVEQDTMMTPPLTVDIVPDGGAGCGDTIVKLVADPMGGVAPYTYNWNTGDTTMMIFATVGDTAIVTVTDSLGSMASDTLIVPFLPAIDSVVVTTTPTGNPEDSTGTATANVFGGTGPYTYVWDTGDTTQTISNLPAGTYCVTVTDVNGCTAEDCGEVEQDTMMSPLMVVATPDDPACGTGFGSATAVATGGTPPYSFVWGQWRNRANG
jgi:hypothetical protein